MQVTCIHPRKLFWYDLNSEQVTYVQGIPTLNEVMVCAESLVSPSLPIDSLRRESTHKRRYLSFI